MTWNDYRRAIVDQQGVSFEFAGNRDQLLRLPRAKEFSSRVEWTGLPIQRLNPDPAHADGLFQFPSARTRGAPFDYFTPNGWRDDDLVEPLTKEFELRHASQGNQRAGIRQDRHDLPRFPLALEYLEVFQIFSQVLRGVVVKWDAAFFSEVPKLHPGQPKITGGLRQRNAALVKRRNMAASRASRLSLSLALSSREPSGTRSSTSNITAPPLSPRQSADYDWNNSCGESCS
jgi:hypothetical protein